MPETLGTPGMTINHEWREAGHEQICALPNVRDFPVMSCCSGAGNPDGAGRCPVDGFHDHHSALFSRRW
jgi:hypothetical protein